MLYTDDLQMLSLNLAFWFFWDGKKYKGFEKLVVTSSTFKGTLGIIGGGTLTSPCNLLITSSFSAHVGSSSWIIWVPKCTWYGCHLCRISSFGFGRGWVRCQFIVLVWYQYITSLELYHQGVKMVSMISEFIWRWGSKVCKE